MSKSILWSRTFWFNAAAAVVEFVPQLIDAFPRLDRQILMSIVVLGNIVLRRMSTEQVHVVTPHEATAPTTGIGPMAMLMLVSLLGAGCAPRSTPVVTPPAPPAQPVIANYTAGGTGYGVLRVDGRCVIRTGALGGVIRDTQAEDIVCVEHAAADAARKAVAAQAQPAAKSVETKKP